LKARELFNKAQIAASSARILLNNGDVDGACNRAYYAMFDAARAALLASGADESVINTKTHSGLITKFSLELVKSGQVSVELGKSLNKVEDLRLTADYKVNAVLQEDATWAVNQADIFVQVLVTTFS